MLITDPDGRAAEVTKDHQLKTLSVMETYIHKMAHVGRAWTLVGQITTLDTADRVVFFFKNTSTNGFEFHSILVGSQSPATITVEYGREYVSGGGTALQLAQLNIGSGQTQSQESYMAQDITLSGTGTDVIKARVPANEVVDVLCNLEGFYIPPGNKFAIRVQPDTGGQVLTMTLVTHGRTPWEEE